MKTFTLTFTEAELETIAAAMDDYMAYADDEFASADEIVSNSASVNVNVNVFIILKWVAPVVCLIICY